MSRSNKLAPTPVNDQSIFECRQCGRRVRWQALTSAWPKSAWQAEDGSWMCDATPACKGGHQGKEVTDQDIFSGLRSMIGELQ